ncbi:MAG: cell division protein FtsA [Bacteroidota bacterium]
MNQKIRTIAAIDIGTTKIVAIVGKQDDSGKIEILGMGSSPSYGVKRGVVLNIEDTVNSIRNAVEQAKTKSSLELDEVYVGIAGQHIKSIRTRGQRYIESDEFEISRDDVAALKEDMYKVPLDAGEEILHVLPQSYIVDNEVGVKNPVGMSGKRLEGNYHIVIGQTASANNIKKCINRVGLNVIDLILEPLASSRAVLTDDEKEAGVALIDIGGGTTDIAVYYDGIIRHTAVIPFGGNVITNDIKTGFSILERHAEQLKLQYGSALSEMAKENEVVTVPGISGREPKEISLKSLAYVIQARMEEIIGAISYQIELSGVGGKLGAGIVLTGGGALLQNLPQLVSYTTGLDIRIGYPNKYLSGEYSKEVNQPMYATSVGLILQGYEEMREKKPDEILKEKVKKTRSRDKDKDKDKDKKKAFDGILNKMKEIFEEKDGEL